MTTARKVAASLPIADHIAVSSLKATTDHMWQLIGFHSLYNVPMTPLMSKDGEFRHMDNERVAMRVGLVAEEFKELLEDGFGLTADIRVAHAEFNQGFDAQLERLPEALAASGKRDGAAIADALGDIVYVCYGMALEMGYDLRTVIEEIHASNLTKLGEDGKPIHREDGKVLKGPNYVAPNIPAALGWDDE